MSTVAPTSSVLRNVSLPGLLRETIRQRREEFGYSTFSPFGLELICFDLRKRRPHLITRPFADDSASARDALDRELARQYTPGNERRGLLMQALFGNIPETDRKLPQGSFANSRQHLEYSEILHPCIETRWRELGYRSFSAYVTGLIRYDLLLLGPHRYFNGEDTAPYLLASLDLGTARDFHASHPEYSYLDELLDMAASRQLTAEERVEHMGELVKKIREMVIRRRERSKTWSRNRKEVTPPEQPAPLPPASPRYAGSASDTAAE